ncbi:hypothetical protein RSAG8_07419, partial [Rhizoctonia solani AG-8 WAC10335]
MARLGRSHRASSFGYIGSGVIPSAEHKQSKTQVGIQEHPTSRDAVNTRRCPLPSGL